MLEIANESTMAVRSIEVELVQTVELLAWGPHGPIQIGKSDFFNEFVILRMGQHKYD